MSTFSKINSYFHVLLVVTALAVVAVDYVGMSVHMYDVFNLPTEILSAKKPNWHENIWLMETIVFGIAAALFIIIYFAANLERHYKQVKSDYDSFMTNRENKKSAASNKTPSTF